MLLRKNVFQLCHDKRKQNSEISYTSLVIESHSWGTVRLESRNGSLGGFHPALPCSAADFDGRHSFDSRTFAHVHNWNEICVSKGHYQHKKCSQCINQNIFIFKWQKPN